MRRRLRFLIGTCEDHGRAVRYSIASGWCEHIDDHTPCEGIIVT